MFVLGAHLYPIVKQRLSIDNRHFSRYPDCVAMCQSRVVQPSPDRHLRVTLSACALTLLGGLSSGWIGPLLPTMAELQRLTLIQAGTLVSISGIGSITATVLSNLVVARLGPKTCLQLGALFIALGMSGVALGNGFFGLACAVVTVGFGFGFVSVASSMCILQVAGFNAAPALNRLHLFFGVGALTGPFAAAAALASQPSYRTVYACGALAAVVITALLSRTALFGIKEERGVQPATIGVMREPELWCYALLLFLYVGIEVGIATWLYTYLVRENHLAPALASLSMSAVWLGLTSGRLVSAFLSTRAPATPVTAAGMVITPVVLGILATTHHLQWVVVLLVATLGFGFGPIYPNTIAEANTKFREASSTVTPFIITAGSLGGIAFPAMTGYIFSHYGLQSRMAALCLAALFMCVVFAALNISVWRASRAL